MEDDDFLSSSRLQNLLLQLFKQFGDFCRLLASATEEREEDLEKILENILSELSQVKQSFHQHIEKLKPVTAVERNAQLSQMRLMLLESRIARIREELQNIIRNQEREERS
ncbi:hypothetical protein Gasu2_51490 [Galdieria sulphuraria]|uniref:Uncharacterized protein n=1 Tax=Galdieria sulphuraria TaxID=130081 RepID=M2XTL2_GALSU|nr:uncharacterized protein Gasu_54490 [Galdieria sulphuraria]EME26998.1 hypothetical protein Gasu_54490 [Galdieria sulphuraria]GJD10991.1 hypothetical protein Gasu2_51490 [Galdieria sulphuraria]|eukprot:XP_005703518.1 hypothetical protein Gasu_54490 [Galdieria sulphuraria]